MKKPIEKMNTGELADEFNPTNAESSVRYDYATMCRLTSRLRELHEQTGEMKSIVSDLAKWSRKYPKGMIRPMSSNLHMEKGLEAIEERAKRITPPEGV
jgi:hypothetical protein